MVDHNTGKLFPYRPVDKACYYRGIHSTGKGAYYFSVTDLLTDTGDAFVDEIADGPISVAAADTVYEILQNFFTFRSVNYFRVNCRP